MEEKNKILAVLCILACIGASVHNTSMTIEFFKEYTTDIWTTTTFIVIAIIIDFGMIAFSILTGAALRNEKYTKVLGWGTLTLLCMGASFFTSQCFDLNNNNKILNNTVANSTAMTRQNDVYSKKSNEITELEKSIKQLKDNRTKNEQKIRNDYQSLIDNARRLNMLTIHKDSVAEITKRMNADIKALDTAIADKEKILNKCNDDLSGIKNGYDDISKNTRTTAGFYALAIWINKNEPESVIGTINVIKNIFILILTVAFGIAFGDFAGRNEDESLFSNIKNKARKIFSHKSKEIPVTAKVENKIGFSMDNDKSYSVKSHSVKSNYSDSELLQIYKKLMIDTVKDNGQVISYDDAAKTLKIPKVKALSVREQLIDLNFLRREGKKTYINQ